MLKDYGQALERVSKLVHEAPKRYTKGLYLIRGLLYQSMGNPGKAKGDLDIVAKMCAQEPVDSLHQEFIKLRNPVSVNPFPL